MADPQFVPHLAVRGQDARLGAQDDTEHEVKQVREEHLAVVLTLGGPVEQVVEPPRVEQVLQGRASQNRTRRGPEEVLQDLRPHAHLLTQLANTQQDIATNTP